MLVRRVAGPDRLTQTVCAQSAYFGAQRYNSPGDGFGTDVQTPDSSALRADQCDSHAPALVIPRRHICPGACACNMDLHLPFEFPWRGHGSLNLRVRKAQVGGPVPQSRPRLYGGPYVHVALLDNSAQKAHLVRFIESLRQTMVILIMYSRPEVWPPYRAYILHRLYYTSHL